MHESADVEMRFALQPDRKTNKVVLLVDLSTTHRIQISNPSTNTLAIIAGRAAEALDYPKLQEQTERTRIEQVNSRSEWIDRSLRRPIEHPDEDVNS